METSPRPKPAPPKKPLPSKETLELQAQIRGLTEDLANQLDIPVESIRGSKFIADFATSLKPLASKLITKKVRFDPPPHLMQNPFAESPALNELLLKQMEQEKQQPVKRNPRRRPIKSTGEKR